MARRSRVVFPGACYHVIARGNRQQAIFHDDSDRRHYLNRLEHYRTRYDFTLYAYVLMTNHVHLLLETGETPLSKIMQGLQFTYAQHYNGRYQKAGHLFQGRYKAILCDRDAYLRELVRYIHLNPARTETPANPWRYRWSSHAAYMGKPSPVRVETSLVLRQFGSRPGPARRAYLAFVAKGLADGHQAKFYDVTEQRFLGDGEFVREVASRTRGERPAEAQRPAAPFDLLVRAVAHACGAEPHLLLHQDRRRHWLKPRALLVYLGRAWSGLDVRELGRRLHRDPSRISRLYGRYADNPDPAAEASVEAWLRNNANTHA